MGAASHVAMRPRSAPVLSGSQLGFQAQRAELGAKRLAVEKQRPEQVARSAAGIESGAVIQKGAAGRPCRLADIQCDRRPLQGGVTGCRRGTKNKKELPGAGSGGCGPGCVGGWARGFCAGTQLPLFFSDPRSVHTAGSSGGGSKTLLARRQSAARSRSRVPRRQAPSRVRFGSGTGDGTVQNGRTCEGSPLRASKEGPPQTCGLSRSRVEPARLSLTRSLAWSARRLARSSGRVGSSPTRLGSSATRTGRRTCGRRSGAGRSRGSAAARPPGSRPRSRRRRSRGSASRSPSARPRR